MKRYEDIGCPDSDYGTIRIAVKNEKGEVVKIIENPPPEIIDQIVSEASPD